MIYSLVLLYFYFQTWMNVKTILSFVLTVSVETLKARLNVSVARDTFWPKGQLHVLVGATP